MRPAGRQFDKPDLEPTESNENNLLIPLTDVYCVLFSYKTGQRTADSIIRDPIMRPALFIKKKLSLYNKNLSFFV